MSLQVPTSPLPQQDTALMDVLKTGLKSPNQEEQADQSFINNENLNHLFTTLSTEKDPTGKTNTKMFIDILDHPLLMNDALSESATTIKQTIGETTTITTNGFLDQSLLDTSNTSTIDVVKGIIRNAAVTPQMKDVTSNTTMESKTANDIIGTVATTEPPMFNETSTLAERMIDVQTELNRDIATTIRNIFGIPQEPITEAASDRSLNVAPETLYRVKQVVQNVTSEINVDSNYSAESMTTKLSSVTKHFLDNTVDDGYLKEEDHMWIYYVILGVGIAVIIVAIVGLTFIYKRMKQNKEFSGYQVSQMKDFGNSSCTN